jgi:hypothetical protein
VTPEIHCDRDVLQKLLTESLPEREETSVSNHLATCADCRHEFEVLAANNEWWTEATQRLSRNAARRNDDRFIGSSSHDDDAHFTTDFAVDFLEPSDDAQALGRLGEYEIVEVIGRGGMGIVLKGFQKELHRHVAVKVLSPHLATSGAARLAIRSRSASHRSGGAPARDGHSFGECECQIAVPGHAVCRLPIIAGTVGSTRTARRERRAADWHAGGRRPGCRARSGIGSPRRQTS